MKKMYCAYSPSVIVWREMSKKFPNENSGEFSTQKSQWFVATNEVIPSCMLFYCMVTEHIVSIAVGKVN